MAVKNLTHVILDFVVEQDRDGIIGTFNMLDFIEAGLKAVGEDHVTAILPGARLTVKVPHASRLAAGGLGRIVRRTRTMRHQTTNKKVKRKR